MSHEVIVPVSDLPESGGVVQVKAEGREPIALYHVDGEWFATDDVCTHSFAYLSEGDLDGAEIECPLHGAIFCIRSGNALSFPATEGLATYSVRVAEDGSVAISLERKEDE